MSTADKPTRPPRLRAVSSPRTAATPADMGPQRPSPLRNVNRPQTASSVPLRMLHQEQLHRVDAAQLPRGAGVSLGHCRTDIALCFGDPDCAHLKCPGHPCNRGKDEGGDDGISLAGKDYSDHHGPTAMAEYRAGQARISRHLRVALCIGVAGLGALAYWLTR